MSVDSFEAEPTPEWQNQIAKVLDETADLETFTNFIVSMVDNDLITIYPDGEAGSLSRRVIWAFPNNMVCWTGKDEDFFLSHLLEEYNEKTEVPRISGESEYSWSYYPASNGWLYSGDSGTIELIDNLTKAYGKPTLVLPWSFQIEQVVEEEVEDLNNYYDVDLEDEGSKEKYRKLLLFFRNLLDEKVASPGGVWDIALDYGDGYMPKFSKAGRFNQFLDALEESGWGLIRDECCGSCSSGSIKWLREDRVGEPFPIFITWGQNSDFTWGLDGRVSHMHLPDTQEEVVILKEFAHRFGLEFATEHKYNNPVPFVFIS